MALKNLADWNEEQATSVCGSACGAADEKKEEARCLRLRLWRW